MFNRTICSVLICRNLACSLFTYCRLSSCKCPLGEICKNLTWQKFGLVALRDKNVDCRSWISVSPFYYKCVKELTEAAANKWILPGLQTAFK